MGEAAVMELEGGYPFNKYNNMVFYATLCHVCKRFGDGIHLKRCGGCKMIAYCSQQHQKQHWKLHKPLCKATQDVLQEYSLNDRGETSEEWDERKVVFSLLVSYKLGRPLKRGEVQMFNFPRECLVCHEKNDQSLEDCQKCATSFCTNHKDGIEHRDMCAPLELSLRGDLLTITKLHSPMELLSYLERISCTDTFQNMKDFINAFGDIQTDSEIPCDVLAAEYSQYLTRPLTLFHAMRLLNFVIPKSKHLVIHVVGACYIEEATCAAWQVLLHLIENVTSVMFIMIGPKLKSKFDPSRVSDDCILHKNESFIIKYHDGLYENYVRNPLFVKPDLVVGFNFCIAKLEIESKTTWTPSIEVLAKQNCPFVLTFITLQGLKIETGKINAILGREVDHYYNGKNPFASLRPYRGLTPEYVFYKDQYLLIYRSLCL